METDNISKSLTKTRSLLAKDEKLSPAVMAMGQQYTTEECSASTTQSEKQNDKRTVTDCGDDNNSIGRLKVFISFSFCVIFGLEI